MGYRVSWIARSSASSAELLSAIEGRLTGERSELADTGIYLLELRPDDEPWVLLVADGSDHMSALTEDLAQRLSCDGCDVLYLATSETSMENELAFYDTGALSWSIRYREKRSGWFRRRSKEPELQGEVPAFVRDLLVKLQKQQADSAGSNVDYLYELVIEAGHAVIGFRHDQEPETAESEPFQVVRSIK